MTEIPPAGTRVVYINDDRVFVTTDQTRLFGWRQAVEARVEGEPDGELFWLLVEHCTLAPATVP